MDKGPNEEVGGSATSATTDEPAFANSRRDALAHRPKAEEAAAGLSRSIPAEDIDLRPEYMRVGIDKFLAASRWSSRAMVGEAGGSRAVDNQIDVQPAWKSARWHTRRFGEDGDPAAARRKLAQILLQTKGYGLRDKSGASEGGNRTAETDRSSIPFNESIGGDGEYRAAEGHEEAETSFRRVSNVASAHAVSQQGELQGIRRDAGPVEQAAVDWVAGVGEQRAGGRRAACAADGSAGRGVAVRGACVASVSAGRAGASSRVWDSGD